MARPTSPRSTDDRGHDALFEVAASTDDEDHRREVLNQIVELYLDFAHRQAAHYAGRGIALDDLKQVAAVALTCAARRYDPNKRVPFLSFAGPTVRGELRKYFRDSGWAVRPTRRVQELQARAMAGQDALLQQLGRSPTPRELAAHLGESLDDVTEALTLDGCFAPLSLERTIDRTEGLTVADTLLSEDDPYPAAEFRITLAPAIRSLKPRDQQIVLLRFFEGLTQAEIGERIGSTQMSVSRALSRIRSELRRAVEGSQANPGVRDVPTQRKVA